MTPTRKRGRPPSPQTLEKRRIQEMLTNTKGTIARMNEEERRDTRKFLDESERWRKRILKDYTHGSTTPHEHAYQVASIGDESLEGYEATILKNDKRFRTRAKAYRIAGTEALKDNRQKASKAIDSFSDLLSRIRPQGPLSMSEAARRMQRDWLARGNYDDAPSIRTLIRWIKTQI
jgi:hypothetical protein